MERDDEEGLAAALRDVLENAAEARQLGEQARHTVVSRYDIQRTADSWLDAYRTVLA